MNNFNIMQINMGKRNITGKIEKIIEDYKIDIMLIQEPCAAQIPGGKTLSVAQRSAPVRAKIWFSHSSFKKLNPILLEQLSDLDTCTVAVHTNDSVRKTIVLTSIYMPGSESTADPHTGELTRSNINNPISHNPLIKEIVIYGNIKNVPLVISSDCNSWHDSWGPKSKSNSRGNILHEFISEMDLHLLNNGKDITFYKQNLGSDPQATAIDITLVSSLDQHLISNWRVDPSPPYADHHSLLFELTIPHPVPEKARTKKKTNFKKMFSIVKKDLDNLSKNNPTWTWKCKSVKELNSKLNTLNSVIMNGYNQSAKVIKDRKRSCDWFSESLRKARNELHALHYKIRNCDDTCRLRPNDDFIRWRRAELQAEYNCKNKEYEASIKAAKKESLVKYLEDLDSLSVTSKLQKIFGKDKPSILGNVKTPSGGFSCSREEASEVMVGSHFCGALATAELRCGTAKPATRREIDEIKRATSASNITRIWKQAPKWKAAGEDGIFNALLWHNSELLAGPVSQLIQSAFELGYCPIKWRTSRVIFIGKPGKDDNTDPKSFRPISLTSTLLKLAERLIKDQLLRNCNLKLHSKNQFAFIKASSTESAIRTSLTFLYNQLRSISKLKKRINGHNRTIKANGMSLVIAIDFSGAFDTLNYDSVYEGLVNRGASDWMLNFIKSLNEGRIIKTAVDDYKSTYFPTKGVAQGSVLSPTLFNLVMDEMLDNLGKGEFGNLQSAKVIGFADDVLIMIPFNSETFDSTFKLANKKLNKLFVWAKSKGLEINSQKTCYSIIHNRQDAKKVTSETTTRSLLCNGLPISHVKQFKYLGIWIDENLNWDHHLNEAKKKGMKTLLATSRMVGKSYGLSPYLTYWVYNSICVPRMLYSCFAWWRDGNHSRSEVLEPVRTLALRLTSGAMRSTPISVMESILRAPKIHDKARQNSLNTAARLYSQGHWEVPRGKALNPLDSVILEAAKLGLPSKSPICTDKDKFVVNEQAWRNLPNIRDSFAYILKDPANHSKHYRWIIFHTHDNLEVVKVVFQSKNRNLSGVGITSLLELIKTAISRGLNLDKVATDDCTILNRLKQKAPNIVSNACKEEASKLRSPKILVSRCESINQVGLDWIHEQETNGKLREILVKFPKSQDEFKIDTKMDLNHRINLYWENSIQGKRRRKNPRYLRFPETIFKGLNHFTSKEVIKWTRADLRLYTCMMSGRALDRKTISSHTRCNDNCTYCDEIEGNCMEHWISYCTRLEAFRLALTSCFVTDPRDITPNNWIEFAKACGFSKYAFSP
jgi:Reverse transcriptase (RNA-dependent DNA polymerase)/Endonuclease-reverse transcriptase